MQSSMLVSPQPSKYVSFVSDFIDKKLSANEKLHSLTPHLFRPQLPSQDQQEVYQNFDNQKVVHYDKLMLLLSFQNSDVQSEIMKFAQGFQSWLVTKMYCRDEAVNQYSVLVLKELNIKHYFGNPTGILLRHIFKEITLNSDMKEIQGLLHQYNDQEAIILKTKNRLQILLEKTISLASFILKGFSVVGGLYTGYLIYKNSHLMITYAKVQYLPMFVNKVVNHTPSSMIRVASKVYDYRFGVFIFSLLISQTRLNQYPMIIRSFSILSDIAYLPITISEMILELPLKVAYVVYDEIQSKRGKITHFMEEKNNFFQAYRINQALTHAETLFVNQVMNLKVKT